MTGLEYLEVNNRDLHIVGVNGRILSPLAWIYKVHGKDHLEDWGDWADVDETLQLMKWYGDYVGRKVKKYKNSKQEK